MGQIVSCCWEGPSCGSKEVQPGYMTLASDPLKVYRCAADEHCPGGPPASCAARRDAASVACGEGLSGPALHRICLHPYPQDQDY